MKSYLSVENFKDLFDLKLKMPQLMLGIEIDKETIKYSETLVMPRFKPGRNWLQIVHVNGGKHYDQRYFVGTLLKPNPRMVLAMDRISDEWIGKAIRANDATLIDVILYREYIQNLIEVDCNNSWRIFAEGCYPIDIEYTKSLVEDKLPLLFDDLIDWKDGFERAAGSTNRWKLTILGENRH